MSVLSQTSRNSVFVYLSESWTHSYLPLLLFFGVPNMVKHDKRRNQSSAASAIQHELPVQVDNSNATSLTLMLNVSTSIQLNVKKSFQSTQRIK